MGSPEGKGELFEAALGATADGIVVVAPDGELLYANPSFARIWGVSEHVFERAVYLHDLCPFMNKAYDADQFLKAAREPGLEESIELIRFNDGKSLEASARPLVLGGEIAGRVFAFRDVTPRVKAEEDLRIAEIRRATLLQHVPAALYEDIVDLTQPSGIRPVFMGDQIEEITGYPASAFMEDPDLWEAIVHPDDRAAIIEANRGFYREPDAYGQVCRIVAADGRVVWVHDWAHIVQDPLTGDRHVFGVIQDITHLREVEEGAREAEARWRAIIDEVPGVVYRYDAFGGTGQSRHGASPWISPSVTEFFGHSPEEWIANPDIWVEMLHPDDREWVIRESERTDRTGEPFDAEYRFISRDGAVKWVHDRAVVVSWDPEGRPRWWQGLLMDVTERRALQERILEAQEAERSRIARAIEDTSLQALTAAGLRASVALAREGVVDDPGSAAVQLSIEQAVASLRRLLFELRPPALDRGGLSAAAGEYLRLVASSHGGDLRLDDRLHEQPGEPLRTVAYRVIQALGRATLGRGLGAAVGMEPLRGGIRIVTQTASTEMDPQDEDIALATEHARSAGGSLQIGPDGTSVEVWLPWADSDQA